VEEAHGAVLEPTDAGELAHVILVSRYGLPMGDSSSVEKAQAN